MSTRARELCRLPFACVDVAVRLTGLSNAVWAMRPPILDGLRVATMAQQHTPTADVERRLEAAWHEVRGQIVATVRAYVGAFHGMPSPTNALQALRFDTARISAEILTEWMVALDRIEQERGVVAVLGNLLVQAEVIGRRLTTSDACPKALASSVSIPNLDQLRDGERSGIPYWLNVDGAQLVVFERTIATTHPSASAEPIKEVA